MTNNNNRDALFADAELPFDHPGRRFDDTPEYLDHSPLVRKLRNSGDPSPAELSAEMVT